MPMTPIENEAAVTRRNAAPLLGRAPATCGVGLSGLAAAAGSAAV